MDGAKNKALGYERRVKRLAEALSRLNGLGSMASLGIMNSVISGSLSAIASRRKAHT